MRKPCSRTHQLAISIYKGRSRTQHTALNSELSFSTSISESFIGWPSDPGHQMLAKVAALEGLYKESNHLPQLEKWRSDAGDPSDKSCKPHFGSIVIFM
ncbi:hypothetical protein AAG906_036624 [Vitis piasezkii]